MAHTLLDGSCRRPTLPLADESGDGCGSSEAPAAAPPAQQACAAAAGASAAAGRVAAELGDAREPRTGVVADSAPAASAHSGGCGSSGWQQAAAAAARASAGGSAGSPRGDGPQLLAARALHMLRSQKDLLRDARGSWPGGEPRAVCGPRVCACAQRAVGRGASLEAQRG
jgi:hypothetical protein